MSHDLTRRGFLGTAAAGAGLAFTGGDAARADTPARPAVLGGSPVRKKAFPSWPRSDALEEKSLLEVLRSGRWFRGGGARVDEFERAYAKLTGAKHCVAVANGTSALIVSLGALDVGPGDEVIVPPYTFVATINAVLHRYALPVFVDSDPETLQMDARKVEAAITDRTAALLPVHLGGSVVDMDTLLAVARARKLPVVEDACQSHLAEWRGRKVGTLGSTGCFSFQVTKNLPSGEGGAVLTNDEGLADRVYAFHNNSRPRSRPGYAFQYLDVNGANFRMTEFQGALLLAQMTRLEEQSRTREQNAKSLSEQLAKIPGIRPARMYDGCTRNAYHLYMFRYDPEGFAGLPRDKFLRALNAEGVPCWGGYTPLNKEAFIKNTLASRGYQKIYGKTALANWEERNRCPANDRLCGEAVWMTQPMLLGPRQDMDQIAEAVRKIQAHAAAVAKA